MQTHTSRVIMATGKKTRFFGFSDLNRMTCEQRVCVCGGGGGGGGEGGIKHSYLYF